MPMTTPTPTSPPMRQPPTRRPMTLQRRREILERLARKEIGAEEAAAALRAIGAEA